jgi:hypothetical protein
MWWPCLLTDQDEMSNLTYEFNLLLADFLKALLKEKKHVVQKCRDILPTDN